jgi:hypothetical protein
MKQKICWPFGQEEKNNSPIIRATCRFDSKIRGFSGAPDFVSTYVERNKNFFQKIEISQNLPSFFAEKWAKNEGSIKKKNDRYLFRDW